MDNQDLGGLFICEDYTLEEFTFDDIKQQLYCLKASVTDFDLTGQIVWPAAVFLAEYIAKNRDHFKNKNIVELGAGTGLSGFVAAQFARKIALTDHNDIVVNLLDKNAQHLKQENLFVYNFSWGTDKLADINLTNSFDKTFTKDDKIDMIIGADIVYWPESLDPLMITLNEALDLNKDCEIYVSFYSRNKYVDNNLENKITAHNLKKETILHDENRYLFKIFR